MHDFVLFWFGKIWAAMGAPLESQSTETSLRECGTGGSQKDPFDAAGRNPLTNALHIFWFLEVVRLAKAIVDGKAVLAKAAQGVAHTVCASENLQPHA